MLRSGGSILSHALLATLALGIGSFSPREAQAVACADMTPNCVEIASDRDTTLLEGNPNSFNGGNSEVFAGAIGAIGIDPTDSRRRGLLRFDVANEPGLAGVTITSASLSLCLQTVATDEPADTLRLHTLHTMLRDWGESTTLGGIVGQDTLNQASWDCAMNQAGTPGVPDPDCNLDWAADGASANGSDVLTATLQSRSIGTTLNSCSSFSSNANLIADAQAWLDTPGSNFGWQLRGEEAPTGLGNVRRFFSREDAVDPMRDPIFGPPDRRPTLRLLYSPAAGPQPLAVRIEELMAGANGDSSIQFIEMKIDGASAAEWGPQAAENDSRMMLSFYDATGAVTGSYEFPSDPPVGPVDGGSNGSSVLIATASFQTTAGAAADFVLPGATLPDVALQAIGGQVCFHDNPNNGNAPPTNVCVSYGDFDTSLTQEEDGCSPTSTPIGLPAPLLPIADTLPTGLARNTDLTFGCSTVGNAAFVAATSSARNSAGTTGSIAARTLAQQGQTLFEIETFAGNGRTCATCHRATDDFGIEPTSVTALSMNSPNDPLFVHLNNPSLTNLEDDCLLQQDTNGPSIANGVRALFLENIDGLANPPSFRNTPHLLNVAATAPYSLSADLDNTQSNGMGFDNLRDFCRGAIEQHLPKTLTRNSDPTAGPLDFREPTLFELQAMEAFQNGITFPVAGLPSDPDGDGEPDLSGQIADYLAANPGDMAAVARGQDLFFGRTGKARCFACHSGPALALTTPPTGALAAQIANPGALGPATANLAFDIATDEVVENSQDICPNNDLPGPELGRLFNTPGLVGVARTGPFFHDHSKSTLFEAVQHYNQGVFNLSPAGAQMASAFNDGIGIQMSGAEIQDVVTFLEAVSVPEPASGLGALAALGCLAAMLRRRNV